MDSIFTKFKKDNLRELITQCSQYVELEDSLFELATNMVKGIKGSAIQELEDRWYKSLDSDSPDYSVYNKNCYLADIWACWVIYSRQYLLSLKSDKSLFGKSIVDDMGKIENIADLGCGFGYTTIGLKELFPKANVIGTNFEESWQYKIAENYGKQYDFTLAPKIDKKVDLVFASEYFEHIGNPVYHLKNIISTCEPKYLIIANSFNTIAIGHFKQYKYKDGLVEGKKMGRIFNNTLRELGYTKVATSCWNSRPSYWKKNE
jgi:SAM-dependent methyltransferase